MTSSDDDILINELGEIETSSFSKKDELSKEDAETSLRELEGEGISIVEEELFTGQGADNQISRDFLKDEGIEILSGDEE